MARGSVTVRLRAPCDRACAPCDCRDSPSPCDEAGVPLALRDAADRLEVRGEGLLDPALGPTLAAARELGWPEAWVRSHGAGLAAEGAAARLRALGARGVVVPVFSQASRAHDLIAGAPGALVDALRGMRAAAAAGLQVAVETPLLEARLQDLEALVDLCRRATDALVRARFYVPRRAMPAPLAPPRWADARPRLAAAVRRCDALGVAAELDGGDGVPPCVLGHDPELAARVRVPPGRIARRPGGFALAEPCHRCALSDRCLGPAAAYHAAWGGADLAPFERPPRELLAAQGPAGRAWLPHQREAARRVTNWVLRPTIHCNQDCPFCSANETSANVLAPDVMLRRIARAARKGVRYLSFSGGEPTLSKDLVHYIRVASRLGIRDVELVTNGTLIDGVEKVRPLKEAGLNRAFVSLHGHDELVSRRATSKVGDHARTVRAVDALVACRVDTELNHVISSINYPYLPRFADFVADRWRRQVGVSFAFVTPQFRALEQAALVPRISDVMPYLRRAMRRMVERDVPFTVGSRQGIPPCFLGEFVAWSDVFHVSARARAEDEPQKTLGPRCGECRFVRSCAGLWRPYAERHGFDELAPVPGPALTDAELDVILHTPHPPRDFDFVPAPLRAPLRDDPPLAPPPDVPAPAASRARLPVIAPSAAGPLRVVVVGAGPQALRLARAMARVPSLRLAGLSSPHVADRDTSAFGEVDRDADLPRLLARAGAGAVVVAAATTAHHALALEALARGLPVLVEKPVTRTLEQAEALAAHPEAARVMVAHARRFAPGMVELRRLLAALGEPTRSVEFTVRARADGRELPPTWARESFLETFYHAAYLTGALAGGGVAAVTRAEARRTARPEWVRVALRYPSGCAAELTWEGGAPDDRAQLSARAGDTTLTWSSGGGDDEITREAPTGLRAHSVERGSDTEAMLAAFAEAVLTGAASPAPVREGADVLATVHAMLDALAGHLTRPGAPKHVASPPMRG